MGARTTTTIAVVCVALGAGFALGRSAPAEQLASETTTRDVRTPTAMPAAVAPTSHADEHADLRACVHRLGEAESRIARGCVAPAAPGTAGIPSVAPPMPVASAEQGARAAAAPDAPTAGAGAPAGAASSADARAFSQGFMTHVVGANDAESRWLQEYVCLVDDRRRRIEADLSAILADPRRASDRAAIDAVVVESRREREAMLADIEARLGKERYQRMRDLGGLGVLSRSCPVREP